MSEHDEQAAVFQWVALKRKTIPALWNCYAVPNGGKRSIGAALYMKAEGLMVGVPDINLDWPASGYHGLRIEMKMQGNKPTANQKLWHRRLLDAGYQVCLCYSAEEAIQKVEEYLNSN